MWSKIPTQETRALRPPSNSHLLFPYRPLQNLPRACTLYNDLKPCGIGTGGYTNCENGCLSDGAPNCWCALNSGCDAGCSGENFSQRLDKATSAMVSFSCTLLFQFLLQCRGLHSQPMTDKVPPPGPQGKPLVLLGFTVPDGCQRHPAHLLLPYPGLENC